MSEKPLGFGIIGCGRIAPTHAKAINECGGAKLVAVADIVEERAIKFSKQYEVDYYLDYKNLLKREDINVVCICTPSGAHPEIGIDAAYAGKHVIVEKPMALTLFEADKLIQACEEWNVKLSVVFQNRFNPAVQKLKKALNENRLGKLIKADATVRWFRDQDYYDSDAWRGTYALDGGVLMNQAIHTIDLLQWFMGPVTSLSGYTLTALRSIEAEDTAVSILEFDGPALGVIEATTTTYPTDMEGSLSVFGEKGTVIIGGLAANKIDGWEVSEEPCENHTDLCTDIEIPNVYGFGHQNVIKDMIDAINKDQRPYVDGYGGRKALEIVLAIYRSSEVRGNIKFPLQGESQRILKARGLAKGCQK